MEKNDNYKCKLLVQRSTCPPGTAEYFSNKLNKTEYAVNPSFLRKATAWEDCIRPEKICCGGSNKSLQLLDKIYKPFNIKIFTSSDTKVIELLKYIENITDATLISLWNEFLNISDTLKIERKDFIQLFNDISERPKFATTLRVPGQSFSGWCLPKDTLAISTLFPEANVIKATLQTNKEIYTNYGDNDIHGVYLFDFDKHKIKLTEKGKEYLLNVRIKKH